ncbi:MAG: hypothetical protein ACD_4C00138G0015 [uncultured bacterium (gcode 4)]|uniref:DUF304 domain-containing protein n=1 Tax=uncultured bacterium (gcode 4) TaxID=1234023 RepID=K2F6U0_9BACT|nr:MAG: hypothetical protein ACD_4C00138G0015 [uncultured bacterium (gcode 4)]
MSIMNTDEYTIIKKHYIILLYYIVKFIFLVFVAFLIYYLTYKFKDSLWTDVVKYFMFPTIFFIFNYAFIKFMGWLIFYFNDLVILLKDKIIILKSSIFLMDDLEIIDISKVMKIDIHCHWFLSNLIWFWNLIIEQQRDELRILHFIPKPYSVFQILREKTTYIQTKNNQ